jgi:site-specific DNA-methyltransferase (adenine-specific)
MIGNLLQGDCLELMQDIQSGSIDLIKADLPYGSTQNDWDVIIPFTPLWEQYKRISKPNGVIALNAVGLFSAQLIISNSEWYKYDWIWEKTKATGHLNANKQPLRAHEQILIFYKGQPTYNFQKTTGHPRKVSTASHKRNSKKTANYGDYGLTTYDSTERYPRSVLKFKSDTQLSKIHSTQKPVALEEYFINTYTNPGELVLDNTAGSGTTAIACINTGRQYICMEKYCYDDMIERVNKHLEI